MAVGLKKQLLEASASDTLLSEATLDELCPKVPAAEVVAPFKPQPPLEDSVSSSKRDSLKFLGKRGSVSQEAHDRMFQLLLQGAIPQSSLEQRRRCKVLSGSQYEIPEPLKEAFSLGYVHPSLPPPLGWVWRCRAGGHWKLGLQGG